jgi:hypothetical protein
MQASGEAARKWTTKEENEKKIKKININNSKKSHFWIDKWHNISRST